MIAERNGRSQALARVLARDTLAPQLCCSQPRMGLGHDSHTATASRPSRLSCATSATPGTTARDWSLMSRPIEHEGG